MQKTRIFLRVTAAVVMLPLILAQQSYAWGHDGHMMINRIAGAALPADMPAFLTSYGGLDALEYYGPEPDHWRSTAEPELNAVGAAEHFIDLEYTAWLGEMPRRRYDYLRALAAAQAAHPQVKMTPEAIGLQPYVTLEYFERLKSAMRDYRTLATEKHDTRPVEAEILFLAGILGHFVADGSMPLHTSIQYNGWVGPNPNGYTTGHKIHSMFEGDFVHDNVKPADVTPLVAVIQPTVLGDVFSDYMSYLGHSHTLVEQTYQLEKAGGFVGAGTPDGKAFVDQRLAAGAVELRDMIYTAWVKSADPIPPYRGN
jgi:hypothetical protein